MPADRGFDRSWMQLGGSSSYFAEYLTGDVLGFEDDGRTVELAELPDDFYVTEHYTDKMLGYLQSTEEGTPWFAYMPYTATALATDAAGRLARSLRGPLRRRL